MKRLAIAWMLVQLVPVTAGAVASAQSCSGDAGGNISPGGVHVVARDAGCATGGGGSQSPRYEVVREVRPEPVLCPNTPDGLREIIRYYLPGTNTLVDTVSRCIEGDAPGDPGPPPPPSPTEVFRSAPLTVPEVHVNPTVRGLVGLETWLWWGADVDTPALTAQAGEWSASIEVDAPTIVWDLGNGDVVEGQGAGTGAEDPSLRYVYESACDCTITLTVEWSGTVTLTHPLAPAPIVESVGPVAMTATTTYAVEEREAVIVG